jgi:hypothetical protein
MPLVFACQFLALARRIIIEAGQAISSIPSAGPHSGGFNSSSWKGLAAWKLSGS